MSNSGHLLFQTVPQRDYLQFWAEEKFQPRRVAQFLELSKADISKVAGVSKTSVRFDQKIPKDVLDRFLEIANICGLVAQFFGGDIRKTSIWFKTRNPMLGSLSPRDMIRYGRYERLRRFIMDALEENSASADNGTHHATLGRTGGASTSKQ